MNTKQSINKQLSRNRERTALSKITMFYEVPDKATIEIFSPFRLITRSGCILSAKYLSIAL